MLRQFQSSSFVASSQGVVAERLKGLTTLFARNTSVRSSPISISFKGGLHKGLTIDDLPKTFIVGADERSDIVLIDDGVPGSLISGTKAISILGTVLRIRVLADGCKINGAVMPASESETVASLPVTISHGGCSFTFEQTQRLEENRAVKFVRSIWGRMILPVRVAALFLLISLPFTFLDTGSEFVLMGSGIHASEGQSGNMAKEAEDLRLKIQNDVDDLNIFDASVILEPDFSITMAANVLPHQHVELKKLYSRHSNENPSATIVFDVTTIAPMEDFPVLSHVSLGVDKYLYFDDIKQVRVGEMIRSGVELIAIDDQSFVVRLDGVSRRISY